MPKNRIIEPATIRDELHDLEVRESAEYAAGRAAFLVGRTIDECPHQSSGCGLDPKRYRWFVGWLDARTEIQFGRSAT